MKNIFSNLTSIYLCLILLLYPSINYSKALAESNDKTQLQIREFQTRLYDIPDTLLAMKAVVNTLQDDGYMLKSMNSELGIITATKEIQTKSSMYGLKKTGRYLLLAGGFIGIIAFIFCKPHLTTTIIEASVNVSNFNRQTKIRANFSQRIQKSGNDTDIKQIDDEKFYQEFFSKIDKSIFIQKEKV